VLAEVSAWLDKWIVDGVLTRATSFVVSASGAMLRLFQTGRVQSYAALMVAGVLVMGWHFAAPHARVAVQENAKSGRYVLSATEGLGYAYRWDSDGDGYFDSAKFGTHKSLELDLKRAEKRTVLLQVLNAFGRVAEVAVRVERPREDKSSTITRIDVYDDGKGGKHGEVRKPSTSGTSPNNGTAVKRGDIAPSQGDLP
jgi:hypothetical protein